MSLIGDVKPQDALDALTTLEESLGWKIIQEVLSDNAEAAMREISEDPNMSASEIHYRRGKMNATYNFTDVTHSLKFRFQNQLMLEQANKE